MRLATEEQLAKWDRAMMRGTDGGRGPKGSTTRYIYRRAVVRVADELSAVDVGANGGLLDATLRILDARRETVAPTSFNQTRNALQSLFAATGREEWVEGLPPAASPHRPLVKVPQDDDVHALLTYQWPIHHQAMFRLMAQSALRVGEVTRAQWRHIDWAQGWLFVPEAKYGERRRVPIWAKEKMRMHDILEELQATLGRAAIWLFPSPPHPDRHIRPTAVGMALRRACDHIGIPHMSPHSLRRWWATQAVRQKMHLPSLQAALGHRDLATTQHYAEGLPERR